jgi:ribonuclease HI
MAPIMASESENQTTPVEIWTDGGCKPNPGPGGWAAILCTGPHIRELSGAEPATTNNRMELTAAAAAIVRDIG